MKTRLQFYHQITKYLCLFLALCFIPSCEQKHTNKKISIVCTFSVLQDLAQQLCKDLPHVQTITVVPNAADPHIYQPRPSNAKTLTQANLVVVNGLMLEGWLENLIKASGYKGNICVAARNISPRMVGKMPDPHIWHDPILVQTMLDNIAHDLIKLLPNDKKQILKNKHAVQKEFEFLDTKYKNIFAKIPTKNRKLLTTHDAFGYMGLRYKIAVLSPYGVSTSQEVSVKDIKNIVETIRCEGIKAVFFEQLSNKKIIKAIANQTKTAIQGILYADSLMEKGTLQETLSYNFHIIAKAMWLNEGISCNE